MKPVFRPFVWQMRHSFNEFLRFLADRMNSSFLRNRIYKFVYGLNSKTVSFGRRIDIRHCGALSIGEDTLINDCFSILGAGGCKIGSYVYTAPKVTLITLTHEPSNMATVERPIEIGDFAWIGAGATILPGITIGRGAIVGAGAVVTADVLPLEIVVGNPAKQIGKRELKFPYRLPGGALLESAPSK